MSILLSLFAGGAGKIIGLLGGTFLQPILSHLQSKDVQTTQRMGIFSTSLMAALEAETQRAAVQSQERIALWGDFWYRSLIILIVAPPAMYEAAVFADSILGLPIVIQAAPARFEEFGFGLLSAFIYGGGAVGAVIGGAKMFMRR